LNSSTLAEQKLTSELSSGLAVSSLSDNPVAAGQASMLTSTISQDDTFVQTAATAASLMQVADSALGSVVTQLNQAISLATQGTNGTLNSSDLKSISNQIAGIRDEVISLANTSYQGQYLFSGSQTGSIPFSLNSGTSPATVTYNGDSNVSVLQTPSGQSIQLNLPGNQVFSSPSGDVLGALNNLVADFASGNGNGAPTDLANLNTALNFLDQQRVTLDNSISRLTDASSAATAESTQLLNVQTNLMQADIPAVSTQLSLTESQQTALINVIAALGSGSLFDKL